MKNESRSVAGEWSRYAVQAVGWVSNLESYVSAGCD